MAWRDGQPLAMTPDLICVLDSVSGEAVGSETIRYGQRVTVIALAAAGGLPFAARPRPCRPARLRLRHRLQERVRRMRRIGIDVGGTNTDAVLIEDGKVVRAMKAPTSEDVTTGILDALKSLGSTGLLGGKRIDGVMIGTTHFINAVVQRRHLSKVAALRLGMPASPRCRPSATGRRISPSWCAAASGWWRAATNMTAGPSCRSTRPPSPRRPAR